MDTGSYFRAKREITNYCEKGNCHGQRYTDCPLYMMNNGIYVRCSVLEQDYPEIAEKYDFHFNNRVQNTLLCQIRCRNFSLNTTSDIIKILIPLYK